MTLDAFLPPAVARALRNQQSIPSEPQFQRFDATLLFADISGWTPLVRELSSRGPSGVEQLTVALNAYFGWLIDMIHGHGGTVEKFAGDALIAMWSIPGAPAVAARAAARCATRLVQRGASGPSVPDTLGLHVGMASGEVVGLLGRVAPSRAFFVLGGLPFGLLSEAAATADRGQVAVTAETLRLLTGEPVSAGVHVITSVPGMGAPPHPAMPTPGEVPESVARSLVHPVLAERWTPEGTPTWLAEMRRVSSLFVNVHLDINRLDQGEMTSRILAAAPVVYSVSERYDGAVHDFLVDDKGLTGIVVFGVTRAHEDDGTRAAQAAMDIVRDLGTAGLSGGAGVATGRVYTGVVGSARRSEFAIIGDPMNRAARLMMKADEVLCDKATRDTSVNRIAYTAVPGLRVKGDAAAVTAYRPTGLHSLPGRRVHALIGRQEEVGRLARRLELHLTEPQFQMVTVEGEAGIGKSTLVSHLTTQANLAGARVWSAAGNAIESRRAYHGWEPIVRQILAGGGEVGIEGTELSIRRLAAQRPDWHDTLPLLNDVLGTQLPETEVTEQLDGEARGEATVELLLSLLGAELASQPTCLVCEDAHWLDSSSLDVLLGMTRRRMPILVALTTRPIDDETTDELRTAVEAAADRIELKELTRATMLEVVAGALQVSSVSDPAADFIYDRARGHPFFAEELARAMHESGLLRVRDGRCELTRDAGDLRNAQVPDTLERIIVSRIDRLDEIDRLLLKVASVFGRTFDLPDLRAVLPVEAERDTLDFRLDGLQRSELVHRHEGQTQRYEFKHAITRDVSYEMMPLAQRRPLHRLVAERMEVMHEDLSPHYPALAHHWRAADNALKGIEFSEKAGYQALRQSANREAARFLEDALDIDRTAERCVPAERRAAWLTGIGKARRSMGLVAESRHSLERALTELRCAIPGSGPMFRVRTVAKVVRHLAAARRLDTASLGIPDSRALTIVDAYNYLAVLTYYMNEAWGSLFSTFAGLDHGRAAGATLEASHLYASAANVIGFMGLRSTAKRYCARAHAVAQTSGSPLALGIVNQYTGHLAACLGDLDWFDRDMHRAAEIYERYGHRRFWEEALVNRAYLYLFRGDLDASLRACEDLEASGRRRDDPQTLGWGVVGQGRVKLHKGHLEQALADLTRGIELLEDRMSLIDGHGHRGLARWRLDDPAGAWEDVRHTVQIMDESPLPAYTAMPGFTAATEAAMELWRAGFGPGDSVRHAARRLCKGLVTLSRASPIAWPRAHLWSGVYSWCRGHPRAARRHWRRALAAATEIGLPADEAQLHFWAVRLGESASRAAALDRAMSIYSRLEYRWELEQLAALR